MPYTTFTLGIMKSFFVFITLLFTLVFHSDIFAQTEPKRPEPTEGFDESYCVTPIPEPIVVPSPKDYSSPKIEWLSSTMIRETIEFSPNIIVEIEHGGCVHFALIYRFIFQGEPMDKLSHIEWIKRIKTYLESIIIRSFEPWQKTIQDEISTMEPDFSLEQEVTIIEGYSHIYFFVKKIELNVTSVEVWYDIAL